MPVKPLKEHAKNYSGIALAALIAGGGGAGGVNWYMNDPLTEHRLANMETRMDDLADVVWETKLQVLGLPPEKWQRRIENLEKAQNEIEKNIIRLHAE